VTQLRGDEELGHEDPPITSSRSLAELGHLRHPAPGFKAVLRPPDPPGATTAQLEVTQLEQPRSRSRGHEELGHDGSLITSPSLEGLGHLVTLTRSFSLAIFSGHFPYPSRDPAARVR
jgi:hypothetical protein